MSQDEKEIEIVGEDETTKKGITFLNVAFIPSFTNNGKPKLVVGIQAKDSVIQTINEFRGDDAIGLLNTLTNPKVKNIVNLEGRKKK
jgi:hypothetical protein